MSRTKILQSRTNLIRQFAFLEEIWVEIPRPHCNVGSRWNCHRCFENANFEYMLFDLPKLQKERGSFSNDRKYFNGRKASFNAKINCLNEFVRKSSCFSNSFEIWFDIMNDYSLCEPSYQTCCSTLSCSLLYAQKSYASLASKFQSFLPNTWKKAPD